MSAEYRLDLHTAAGVKVAEITDFLMLSYSRRVNAPGLLTVTLRGDHPALTSLELDGQAIVYRRNPTMGLGTWTADFWGLWRYQERRYTDHDTVELRFPGILSLLARRIVAWAAGTTNRSSFQNVKAETVMKTLVSYNAGANATTANGRIRNGAITGLTVETDQARGNTISRDCAYRNLLEVLQELAPIAGGDFDLVKTGTQAWEFRWYTGQRGTDRTATLLFALERGNMAEPRFAHDRLDERTVAIVGGQGEGVDRAVVVRTGADYAATNDIEVFVDARSESTTDGLDAKGDAKLFDVRARPTFKFSILQTPACYYGVHYFLGDLVTARYRDIQTTQKIVGVSVSLDRDGAEKIDVETMLV
ncbi:MAG: hypothetical protein IRY83_04150 [Chloroflexi bacterium]|nr:hypothetical protein [Chloroflexota bacterium]